jgi:hypothetical protein
MRNVTCELTSLLVMMICITWCKLELAILRIMLLSIGNKLMIHFYFVLKVMN